MSQPRPWDKRRAGLPLAAFALLTWTAECAFAEVVDTLVRPEPAIPEWIWKWLAILLIAALAASIVAAWCWRRRLVAERAQAAHGRDSEALFRQLAEGLPDMIQLLDRNGTVLYASPSTSEVVGFQPDQLLGKSATHYVHPDDRTKMSIACMAGSTGHGHSRVEVRAIRPDGRVIWLQTDLRGIGDAQSPDAQSPDTMSPSGVSREAIRFVSTSRDVTTQHETAEALLLAKEEIDAMLYTTGGALFRSIVRADGSVDVVFVTESIERLTGYTAAEVTGTQGWLALRIDPAFNISLRQHYERLLEHGGSTVEYRFRRKDGVWIWMSISSRLTGSDGAARVVGIAVDATRRHQIDMQLAQTAKLAMLGEITTGMAHELNQPLAGISMAAENALALTERDTIDRVNLRQKLNRIIVQTERAAAIIDHMRVFGRREDDQPTSISVAQAIQGAMAIMRPRLRLSSITVTSGAASDLPPVSGHLVLLEQVLVNLITNAADAIEMQNPPLPEARRHIEIGAAIAEDRIAITVTDHAGGIPEALLGRLFEPFFTTKPVGRGTGLGLSISYGIITDMGGTVTAHNRDDGAMFEIRLSPMTAEVDTTPV